MILYRSKEFILYHLVWVVDGWLVKKLKIVEKLSGSATTGLGEWSSVLGETRRRINVSHFPAFPRFRNLKTRGSETLIVPRDLVLTSSMTLPAQCRFFHFGGTLTSTNRHIEMCTNHQRNEIKVSLFFYIDHYT